MTATPIQGPAAGQTAREDFGGRQLTVSGETASSALATQARAAIEARYVMALQRPRDIELARVKILGACKRPTFAANAIYSKPVGQKENKETGQWEDAFAEGLNIRFAEEAIRCHGNAMTETTVLYEDGKKRITRVSATDFESNVVHYKDLTIEKTIERRKLKKNQQALGTRLNSYGDLVYIVEATDDEVVKKEAAMVAKAIRDKILMLIPSDIQEEAKAQIRKTQADQDAKDPAEAKRKVIDAFAEIGVMPDQVASYLGHDIAIVQPAELKLLRGIYAAIHEGETTWAEVIDQKDEKPAANAKPKPSDLDQAAARAKEKRESEAKKGDTSKPPASTAKPGDVAGDLPDHMKTEGERSAAAKAAETTTTAAKPKPSTTAQRSRIAVLITDKGLGYDEVNAKYAVASTSELTFDQAAEAIANMEKMPDAGEPESGSAG